MAVTSTDVLLRPAGRWPDRGRGHRGLEAHVDGGNPLCLDRCRSQCRRQDGELVGCFLQGTFGKQGAVATQAIGQGDYVQVTIWEAASGGLFSAPTNAQLTGSGSRTATIPEQVVGPDGAITVPYAGRVQVRGRTPQQVEQAVVTALTGKAIEPQALVTVTKNIANTVTVVGEVTGGARVPLTTRGDRILDVVASAGGTRAAAHETFVTLVRGPQSVRIPMQALLISPAENVFVRPGDVISVAKEPQTFTSAGATGQNSVVPFDSIGITLDQAIARAGGLSDTRADPGGVFVIRYERPEEYDQLGFRRLDPGASSGASDLSRQHARPQRLLHGATLPNSQ